MTAVERPWGNYVVLGGGAGYQVKQIVVRPAMRVSYQRHRYRAEHWLIVTGQGKVTINGVISYASPGDSVDIAAGEAHRMENTGQEDLVYIEIQRGPYLGEDDITRLEDDFGRSCSGSYPVP
jgi:mannose-6-phosphate isomerase-like protein (cupin superfamily)